MLNIIGIGLRGLKSITLEEADVIRSGDIIYIDEYTSVPPAGTIGEISGFFQRKIISVGREFIEGKSPIVESCESKNVVLLVVGDGMSATTHGVLAASCRSRGIDVKVYENASIVNAIPGRLGLYGYRMGPPVSLPFLTDGFFPQSVFSKIYRNHENGMHTIVLLDLKDGKTIEPYQAFIWLKELENRSALKHFLSGETICVVSALYHDTEKIVCGNIDDLMRLEFDSPSSIVILSKPDAFEIENLRSFSGN
ncbi:MAG: diphthine synthase [Thermoplasmataceae archaeon]